MDAVSEGVKEESQVRRVNEGVSTPVFVLHEFVHRGEVVPRDRRAKVVLEMVVEVAHEERDHSIADDGTRLREKIARDGLRVLCPASDVREDHGDDHRVSPCVKENIGASVVLKGRVYAGKNSCEKRVFCQDVETIAP